jgi:hypothetical protein
VILVRGEPLEGLEEALDVSRRDDRAGIGDGQDDTAGLGAGRDVDAPGGLVVADGVVDQVAHKPLDEAGVTADGRRADGGRDTKCLVTCADARAEQDGIDDGGQLDRFA